MPDPDRPRMGQGQATSRRRTLGDGTMTANAVERQYNERSMSSATRGMTSARAALLLLITILFTKAIDIADDVKELSTAQNLPARSDPRYGRACLHFSCIHLLPDAFIKGADKEIARLAAGEHESLVAA